MAQLLHFVEDGWCRLSREDGSKQESKQESMLRETKRSYNKGSDGNGVRLRYTSSWDFLEFLRVLHTCKTNHSTLLDTSNLKTSKDNFLQSKYEPTTQRSILLKFTATTKYSKPPCPHFKTPLMKSYLSIDAVALQLLIEDIIRTTLQHTT